jgi:hypothetical protein
MVRENNLEQRIDLPPKNWSIPNESKFFIDPPPILGPPIMRIFRFTLLCCIPETEP